jgi:predicted PurR-regulated permease PerM
LINGAAGLTIFALVIAGLYLTRDIMIPLVAAGFLSFLLQPLVQWLVDWRLPRALAVTIIVLSSFVVLGTIGTFLAREVSALADELPRYESNLRLKARDAAEQLQGVGVWTNAANVLKRIEGELAQPSTKTEPLKVEVQSGSSSPFATLIRYAELSLKPLTTIGLMFLFTVFILLQYHDIRDRIVRLMGATEIGRSTQALNEAALDLAQFFRLQATLNVSFGLAIGVVLWVIGIPNAPLWGAIAALSRFVPYVGGILAAFFPLLMAASLEPGWGTLVLTGAVVIAAEFAVGQFVEPLLFGSKTRLSPLAVLLCAAFWTGIWGPIALILAVPLTLSLVVFGEHIPPLAFLRVMLGNEPALTPEQRLYHLLLAGDASQAAEEASRWIEKSSVVDYLDQVAVPAFAIAARDSNRGVLRAEQLDELKITVKEFVALCRDSDELQRERSDVSNSKDIRQSTVLILPARGTFDHAIGELLSVALDNHQTHAVCSAAGGLTGIAAFHEDYKKTRIDYLAMVSVGGATVTQLNLLIRRAVRDLGPPNLGVFFRTNVTDKLRIEAEPSMELRVFETIKDLKTDIAVRSTPSSPPRKFETITGSRST